MTVGGQTRGRRHKHSAQQTAAEVQLSEIYGELSKRQLRTAGLRLHEAVDVLAASQPMATERQAAYMESIVLSRGRRAREQTPRVWMRHLLATAAASQWINGWT